ncbi:response regulator transcription factor [Proteiniclasticum sp. SCR006]|uniref:Stage 0 sporulation protein A homolog n=1 Tax=Proteiniclasticum aestuarii TaxID=2817862 RepID=A0A939HAM4_9CLOT|nr:response regulator transcription factor [Proteiniclasticum aestuarii]MBO1264110.1 response regulator transcription factor [Proteiniclasticum aestuarii]
MRNILIVEDERRLARFMELELTHEGYNVDIVSDGQTALMNLMNKDYDVMLLDLMIPIVDGIEVTKRARTFTDIPIIMLTARDGLEDKVKGFDIGADEYMTKPFEMEELLARLRALFRKSEKKPEEARLLQFKGLTLSRDTYEVHRDGVKKELTKKEFDLLAYLLENQGIVLTREKILNNVWGFDFEGETNVVDVYIRFLRSKLDDGYEEKLIHTVRGAGYIIR